MATASTAIQFAGDTVSMLRGESSAGSVLILEAPPGEARWKVLANWANETEPASAAAFLLPCSFAMGGPWAGVKDLFSHLLPQIQNTRPELLDAHSFELVSILPTLAYTLKVRNPSLTDLAKGPERTRNYAADRANRIAHGLIDLLDQWKTHEGVDAQWSLALDSFDHSGTMAAFFFTELVRRRGVRLNLRILIAVDPGAGANFRDYFPAAGSRVLSLDLEPVPWPKLNPAEASRLAVEVEERLAEDPIQIKAHLSNLISLWQAADRGDKLFHYKYLGLEMYNTAGFYQDALRFGEELLSLAGQYAPNDDDHRWSIILKLMMAHLGLNEVPAALQLARQHGQPLADKHPHIRIDFCYVMATLRARYSKTRDFIEGEHYFEQGLRAIDEADLPAAESHFRAVFNRNGLAMIRTFQGRHKEAIDLCRSCIERLNAHLAVGLHKLHRSVLFYNMAQVYAITGSSKEALECLSVAMEMDPYYSEYYNDRGNILMKLGRLEEAKASYLTAIELSPPYFEVFANLGQCHRLLGDMQAAVESYSRALDLFPTHSLALLGRAKAHEELGESVAAVADYGAALALDPKTWEAWASRAVLHYEAGHLSDSLRDVSEALRLKPDSPDLYLNRAIVLADIGSRSQAVADLHSALALGPAPEDKSVILSKLASYSALDFCNN